MAVKIKKKILNNFKKMSKINKTKIIIIKIVKWTLKN